MREKRADRPLSKGAPHSYLQSGPRHEADVAPRHDHDVLVEGCRIALDGIGQTMVDQIEFNSRSGPFDPCRIATARSVMRVQIRDLRLGEQARDAFLQRLAVDHLGIDHHIGAVEGTQRDHP